MESTTVHHSFKYIQQALKSVYSSLIYPTPSLILAAVLQNTDGTKLYLVVEMRVSVTEHPSLRPRNETC